MRIAIAYDCLYPSTVGGVERWYQSLALRLDRQHEVTYLTRRQWPRGESPGTPFRTVAVAPSMSLYTRGGRRRIAEALVWAGAVFWHLLRHGRSYDVVHTVTVPYLSLPAAWLALRLGGSRAKLVVDWFEVWGTKYWVEYLGPVAGRLGRIVELASIPMADLNFTFSDLHAKRLAQHRGHGPIKRLSGLYETRSDGATVELESGMSPPSHPRIVYAGRHMREKRVAVIPAAIAEVRKQVPDATCSILGEGPDTQSVIAEIARLGLEDVVELPGKVSAEDVSKAITQSACLILPSEREGYGLVVVESVARGTPVVVARAPDSSAAELVEPGVNGLVAESVDPRTLSDAIVDVIGRGEDLRESTRRWYEKNAYRLSAASSAIEVERSYRELAESQARR